MPSASPVSSVVSDSGRSAPPGLWRDRDFRRLWAGQTASQLGEHTTLIVLPLFAVLQLGAGAWVDRWRTRTVMVVADAGRTLALGAAAVAGLLGRFGLPALFAVAFAVGALSVFFDVSYQASLVRLVKRDRLLQGNSALEGSRSAAQIGGSAGPNRYRSARNVPLGYGDGSTRASASSSATPRCGPCASPRPPSSSPSRP